MTIGVSTFNGQRLTQARVARGFTKKRLAELVGISGTQVTRYESGLDNPQIDRLDLISDKLNFPIGFFQRPTWEDSDSPVFWRSQVAETKTAREMTEQRIGWLKEVFDYLEHDVEFPPVGISDLQFRGDYRLLKSDDIEVIAERARARWGLRDLPIPDVTLALENVGIPVVHLNIPSDKQDGFCRWSERLQRMFVGINIHNISCARARFDAAHELGHALMHQAVRPEQLCDKSLHKLLETQAHRFAGAFLFPREAFFREVEYPSLDYFCNLKRRWGMSIAAMVYRAFDLGLIDKEERTTCYRNMTRRKWKGILKEPFDDPKLMPLETPRMLRRAFEACFGSNMSAQAAFFAEMALPESEIRQFIFGSVQEDKYGEVIEFRPPETDEPISLEDLESGTIVPFSSLRRNR